MDVISLSHGDALAYQYSTVVVPGELAELVWEGGCERYLSEF